MRKLLLVATCIICALALASPAMAITLDLSYLFGSADPGSPAEVGDVQPRLQHGIDLYNTYNPTAHTETFNSYFYTVIYGANVPDTPPLPDVGAGVKIDTTSLTNTINDPYLYLVAKYDNKNFFYYLGGETGSITLVNPIQQGISNIVLFNPTSVPEPTTLLLLGGGLIGLWGARRKLKK